LIKKLYLPSELTTVNPNHSANLLIAARKSQGPAVAAELLLIGAATSGASRSVTFPEVICWHCRN
jgi:hypothetical protein